MPLFDSIVVAGTPFSGKTTLAKLLADHFGWKYFSSDDLLKEVWKEKYPKGETNFENYLSDVTDEDSKEMDRVLGEFLKKGHVVADVRHGFLHKGPQSLVIFTHCDIEVGARRALEKKEYPGKDFSQVMSILEKKERDEADLCKRLYGEDYRDSKNYDVAFDATNAPPEAAIELVTQFDQ